jgi:trimeric autotransporter adhesin
MNSLIQLKTLGSRGRNPARSLPFRRGFLLIPLILVFAFSPNAQTAPSPETPDPGAVKGTLNTADGDRALQAVTAAAIANSAFGAFSMFGLTTGNFNTGVGAGSLDLNNADSNTAVGAAALLLNTTGGGADTGTQNVAVGTFAMEFNTGGANDFDGSFNDAVGAFALNQNTIGKANNAFGNSALFNNTIGNFNVAVGDSALFSLATSDPTNGNGNANTAVGELALASLTTGGGNTAVGDSALVNSITGYQNIAVGYVAGQNLTTGGTNIYISNPGVDTESDTIRIGNVVPFTDIYGFPHPAHTATYIAAISGTAVVGDPVVVDANGQLGTATSSARFKKAIKPMDKASEAILAVKPVSFQYKSDSNGMPQFGLIAEEVAKVNPDLVVRDRKGEIYSVRYEAVNAMLLNEFLKEHRKVEKLTNDFQATVAQEQREIQALAATVKEQAAQIQKVSAQLEASKPAPQVVNNP